MFYTFVFEIHNGVLETLLETLIKTTKWSVKISQKRKKEYYTLVLMISRKPVIANSIKFII